MHRLLSVRVVLFLTAASWCGAISVPTGKETPITPARSTTAAPVPRVSRAPAPVFEYTQENPEPEPLDPSYRPVTYKYFNVLTPNAIYYVPMRLKIRNYDQDLPAKQVYNVKMMEYQPLRRPFQYQFSPQEEYKRPEDNLQEFQFRKLAPLKGAPSKAVFAKEYSVRQPLNKSGYPKKATAYPDHLKYY